MNDVEPVTTIELVKDALLSSSVERKTELIHRLKSCCASDIATGYASSIQNARSATEIEDIRYPGQPGSLQLVHPKMLKQRKLGSPEGRAIFLHAIAHIEFNAINLALDAIYRFRDLPDEYYRDWLTVAAEEARHHRLIAERLVALGFQYGDFPVHNGLWDIAYRTRHDLVSRMAMVPCVFEARGLDVTPPMIGKLQAVGDHESADILQLILDEEIGHVAIGIRWYQFACQQQGLQPVKRFGELLDEYLPNRFMGPFNVPMRLAAGFSPQWIDYLEEMNIERRG